HSAPHLHLHSFPTRRSSDLPKRRAVDVFHAGWRGTLRRIVEKGVGEMQRQFGTLAGDLKVAIGPGIHDCCCEVGPEVRDKFASQDRKSTRLNSSHQIISYAV